MTRALKIGGQNLARQWSNWRSFLTSPEPGDPASGLLDWMEIWTRPPWRR